MTTPKKLWKDFKYFPHQLSGIQWMLDKEINGTVVPPIRHLPSTTIYGGFQCDEMGLGKTIQMASVIVNHLQPMTLLFAPLAMIDTWTTVLQRSGCKVYHIIHKKWVAKSSSYTLPLRFIGNKNRPVVYITNYEKVCSSYHLFLSHKWNRIILDEAHKIRNGKGEISKNIVNIEAKLRWAITGTPIVNSLKDIVTLMAFLGVSHYPKFGWVPDYLTVLSNILLHRSMESLRDVLQDAPPYPIVEEMILPFSTQKEEDFYHGVQGATKELELLYQHESLTQAQLFTFIIRLRQISVHPQIYISAKQRQGNYERDDWKDSSTKLDAIHTIIRKDEERIHKYIVFCQFHEEMSLIRDSLIQCNLVMKENVLMYHGGLTQGQRAEVLQKSKESTERTVMLIQLHAGGVGLNLQEYDRMIFVSPWWTSAMMDQAMARAVRMGQTKVVHVYHLKLNVEKYKSYDIDRWISSTAEQKRQLLQKIFRLCSVQI